MNRRLRRVLFLNPVGNVGGAERVLLSAVRQIRRQRSAWALSAVLTGHGPLAARLRERSVDVHVIPLPEGLARLGSSASGPNDSGGNRLWPIVASIPASLDFLRRTRDTIRRLDPDLIHSNGMKTHLLSPFILPFGRTATPPLLWHIHDYIGQRQGVAKLLRRTSSGVSQGLAVSHSVEKDARAQLPHLSLEVLPNGIDTDHFSPGNPARPQLDPLAGLSPAVPGTVRVGLIATYANWKGHSVFLDALALVPQVRGYIIGGPIYSTAGSQVTREELADQIHRLGLQDRVGLIPFQEDPVEVYRELDVVVHASTKPEPFGLTIAEAMSCGRAVIAGNVGGAAERYEDGISALGHTPGDKASLAACIRQLVQDPVRRARLGIAARAHSLAHFQESQFGERLIAIYDSLLSRRSDHFLSKR